jgi:putative molybdopterin biosynthesis protein
LSETWHCTIGTTQHAIQKLVSEGLVSTHAGKETRVIGLEIKIQPDSIKKANLIHRTESLLLEAMTSGFTPVEIEDAFRVTLDRWRLVSQPQEMESQSIIRFSGSHDLVVSWLAMHFGEISPGYQLSVNFSGSMAGLASLIEDKSEIAGAHIWNEGMDSYNTSFLKRNFPGEKLALIALAKRRIGLLVKSGNPKSILGINDIFRRDIQFINRQPGSGTRIYLDTLLKNNGLESTLIKGYSNTKTTHSEIAAEIVEEHADVGLGIEAAAKAYNLNFIPLNSERYDLVVKPKIFETDSIQNLIKWLKSDDLRSLLDRLGGYDHSDSGEVNWT